ncbi:deoxyribonuclease IV [Spiroplasma endosymbiont of 'Nebria riversi']|uniref:deoxyribonuclease IV n=1 Tax=Spiroplasma endosymbiont of 'Nebria riversi' TaxID=2792084 RepID=UPI001C03EDC9|nr:deoxyribonuclease IV [Spiroplasma endosymbiont of 'Nebria riversi']
MKNKLILGCHVSMKNPDYLVRALNEAISYGANAMMFYTGDPQNTRRKPLDQLKIDEFKRGLENHNLDINNVIIHAPYIINLANSINPNTYLLAKEFLKKEINRSLAIGAKYIVLHPGSSSDASIGLQYIIDGLNEVLEPNQNIKIALETMSGKGSELGINFLQLQTIIRGVKYSHLVGVCWDTCHLNDAGYDLVNNLEQVIEEFDKIIGLDKLFVIHLNDSKNIKGSHKDRHENIGYGNLGFDSLCSILYHPKFANIIKILETPWNNSEPPYKEEIIMLKNKQFNNFLNR